MPNRGVPVRIRLLKLMLRGVAILLTVIGAYMIAFGDAWAPAVLTTLSTAPLGAWIELVVPFFPMLPIVAAAFLAIARPI